MAQMIWRTDADRPGTLPGTAPVPASADYQVDWRLSLRLADRACCCSARPSVAVIMPPAPGRPHATELLLCRHHYRQCEHALELAGAAAFDSDGLPLTPQSWLLPAA